MRNADVLEPAHLLRLGEAARLLGVTRQHAARLAASGALPPIRTALGNLYRPSDVERLAAERRERARTDGRMRVPATP